MSTASIYQQHDNIAVITLNSPPVNGLGHALRLSIRDNYRKALADDSIEAIVLASSGKLFCGGADITEFSSAKANASPNLGELVNEIEESSKPVVAAINGMALGGGLELCLSVIIALYHQKQN